MVAALTQVALARKTGVSVFSIRDYEEGRSEPKWAKIVKLMKVLGGGLVTLGIVDEPRPFRPKKP